MKAFAADSNFETEMAFRNVTMWCKLFKVSKELRMVRVYTVALTLDGSSSPSYDCTCTNQKDFTAMQAIKRSAGGAQIKNQRNPIYVQVRKYTSEGPPLFRNPGHTQIEVQHIDPNTRILVLQ